MLIINWLNKIVPSKYIIMVKLVLLELNLIWLMV
jgi:hypothetical protein